jgi:hypothetical protein
LNEPRQRGRKYNQQEGLFLKDKEKKMCGTLKFEGVAKKKGEVVTAVEAGKDVEAPWTGFAKSEKKDWWMQYGVPATVKADTITEGSVQCEVAVPSSRLLAVLLNKDVITTNQRTGAKVIIGKPGEVKLFTRAAQTDMETDIHERWPVSFKLRADGRGLQFWTMRHIVERGTYKLSLPEHILDEVTPIPARDLGEPDEVIAPGEVSADVPI